jgi:hypothetical protein
LRLKFFPYLFYFHSRGQTSTFSLGQPLLPLLILLFLPSQAQGPCTSPTFTLEWNAYQNRSWATAFTHQWYLKLHFLLICAHLNSPSPHDAIGVASSSCEFTFSWYIQSH